MEKPKNLKTKLNNNIHANQTNKNIKLLINKESSNLTKFMNSVNSQYDKNYKNMILKIKELLIKPQNKKLKRIF